MKNKLTDLNDYLFEALDCLTNDELDADSLEREIRRAEALTKVSDQIIHNAELQFKVIQHADEYGYGAGQRGCLALIGENDAKKSA